MEFRHSWGTLINGLMSVITFLNVVLQMQKPWFTKLEIMTAAIR